MINIIDKINSSLEKVADIKVICSPESNKYAFEVDFFQENVIDDLWSSWEDI